MKRKPENDPKCEIIGNRIMAGNSITVIGFKVFNQIVRYPFPVLIFPMLPEV